MSAPHPTHPAADPAPRPPAPRTQGPEPWLLLGTIVFAGAGIWWALKAPAAESQQAARPARAVTAVVQRGNLEVRMRLMGNVSARRFSNIVAPKLRMPESDRPMLLMTLAKPGQLVRKGDVIAEFDTVGIVEHLQDTRDGLHERRNRVEKQQAALDVAGEALVQQIKRAKAALDKALLDLKTNEVRSAITREKYKLAVEEAELRYQALQEQLALQLASQSADLRLSEIEVELEKLHVDRHQSDLERMTLHAPTDGIVVVQTMNRRDGQQVTLAVGDRVYPGSPMMRVVDRSTLQVECTMNQADSYMFRIGQAAIVRVDAFPGAEYQGKVYSIGALANVSGRRPSYRRGVPLTVTILNPDERLLPNLTASADVLLDREENVLLAPADAVKEANGQSFVYVQKPDGVEQRPVTVVRVHGTQAAISEGVAEGEVLVIQ